MIIRKKRVSKKQRLWKLIKHYDVIPLVILAIGLYFTKDFIVTFSNISKNHSLYNALVCLLSFLLFISWLIITYVVTIRKLYFMKTGRYFLQDRIRYKRNYFELVRYFKDADPHKLDTTIFSEQTWKKSSGLIFGTDEKKLIAIPANSECNIAVFGPPGSGKTSGIAIINAMRFKGSVLAVDIKGDLYNYVSKYGKRKKILRFCPDDANALRESCRFDPFSQINEMNITSKKLYLESIATVLIPDDGGSEGNYFTSRARKIFQGITHLMMHENSNTSFPDVIHSILRGNIFEWVTKAIQSDCDSAKELLASFHGNSEKNVTSAYDALASALVRFSSPVLDELLNNTGKCISMKDLENGYDIYLQIAQEHLDAYAPLFTLIIQSFSIAFTKRPDTSSGIKNRPILMLLDEFPQLTFSYKLINSNLSTLRSKSIICMIIQQNLSQLQNRYNSEGARSIIGNCNYHIILGSNDITSSEVFSNTFGSRKVLKISNSTSKAQNGNISQSVQETTEKIFPPEHFGDLAFQNKMIIYFKGKYCECEKLNCYDELQKNSLRKMQ